MDVSIGIPALITEGLEVVKHRPVHVTVSGIESVRNIGWSVGTTLANLNQPGACSRKSTAIALRQLAYQIEHGPHDNLGVNIRTELRDNLEREGILLDSIWRVP